LEAEYKQSLLKSALLGIIFYFSQKKTYKLGIIQKQSVKGLFYAYGGAVLGFITTGYLMPRFLQTDQIGLLRIIVSYASLLAQFSGLGFSIVVVKMFPFFRDQKTRHHGFMGLFLLVSLVGFIITMLIFQFYQAYFMQEQLQKSELLHHYFYWVAPLTIFILLYNIGDTLYRSLFDAVKGMVLKEMLQRLLILIALALFLLGYIGFDNFANYYFLAFAAAPLLLFYSLWKENQIRLKPDFSFISKSIRKQISNIAIFGLISSFSGILVLNIDVLMVERFLGLSQAGIYTITFFFGALILIPSRPVTRISSIIIAESFKNHDLKNIDFIYRKSSITLTVISFWVFLGLLVNMDNIMLIIGENYRSGYYVILLIGLANVVDMTTGVVNQIIFNSNIYRYSSYMIGVFAILIVLTNLIFIPIYGIIGAAMATFISKAIYNVSKIAVVKTKLNLFPYTIKSVLPIVFSLFAFFIQYWIPPFSNFIIDILMRSTIVSAAYLGPVIIFKVSSDINSWVSKISNTLK